jgi:hypothetical protein
LYLVFNNNRRMNSFLTKDNPSSLCTISAVRLMVKAFHRSGLTLNGICPLYPAGGLKRAREKIPGRSKQLLAPTDEVERLQSSLHIHSVEQIQRTGSHVYSSSLY